MKNMIKMSLVAAVAVAGLSSTVAAKPLEEAIKNVDVSGMIRLRFESTNDGSTNARTDSATDFDTAIKLVNKVTDNTTATVIVEADKAHSENSAASSRLNAELSIVQLTTKLGAATVNVGRVGIPGPFDDAQGGDGFVTTVPVGPVTVAAGFFTTTSISNTQGSDGLVVGRDAYELALMGQAGPVALDVWYAHVTQVVDLISIHAAAKAGPVMIDARHTKGELNEELGLTNDEATLTKITASAKAGMVNLMAGFAMTGTDNDANSGSNRIALDDDNDAATDLKVQQASVGALSDATAFVVSANADIIPKVNVGATYLTVDYDNATNVEKTANELLLDVKYKLDTNLALSGKYSVYNSGDVNAQDQDFTRVELKYTF